MSKMKNGDIRIINNKEYKFITLRGRSKWVSRDGDLINPFRNQEAKTSLNADGYPCTGGSIPVHLYVAYAWVDGYFQGAEVNHKDFDRCNYKSTNLEWVTHRENVDYTLKNNYECVCKSKQGIKNGNSKYSEAEVRNIRNLYDKGLRPSEILHLLYPNVQDSKEYRRLHANISNIVKRKNWNNL